MALAEFTSAGAADFRQRYRGVFGWYPTETGEMLVKVTGVDEQITHFENAQEHEFFAYADKGVKFKFIPVTKKVFIFEGTPVLAQRIPQRQYRRGICSDNTAFTIVQGGYGLGVSFNTVAAYVKGGYTIPKQLTYGSYALNEQLSVSGDRLYVYDIPVGIIDNNTVKITEPIFMQEVKDYLRDNNIETKVVA